MGMYQFQRPVLEPHPQGGFTLVEMIVALALFSAILTISVGALLVLVTASGQLRNEQSVMSNLSFAVDSMTRELRTGTRYFCVSAQNQNSNHAGGIPNIFNDSNNLDDIGNDTTSDCPNGRDGNVRYQGVSLIEAGDSITGDSAARIAYYYDSEEEALFRRVGDGAAEAITSSGLRVIDAEFFVAGAESYRDGDAQQPSVTIFLEVQETNSDRTYRLQTTVTQRIFDL